MRYPCRVRTHLVAEVLGHGGEHVALRKAGGQWVRGTWKQGDRETGGQGGRGAGGHGGREFRAWCTARSATYKCRVRTHLVAEVLGHGGENVALPPLLPLLRDVKHHPLQYLLLQLSRHL